MVLKKLNKIIKMRGKKGFSHVEIVLSFVIFIGFLIFLIAVFKPFKYVGGETVYLDNLERKLKEVTSIEASFQTLSLGEEASVGECFYFDYNLNKVAVKDENEQFVEAMKENEKLYINSNKKFFYLSSCSEFYERDFELPNLDEDGYECTDIENNYTLGLFRSYEFTSFSKIKEIYNKTINDYDSAKELLDLPQSKDFSFSVTDRKTGGQVILNSTKTPPEEVRSLGRSVPIQLVQSSGEIKYYMLNIQVW